MIKTTFSKILLAIALFTLVTDYGGADAKHPNRKLRKQGVNEAHLSGHRGRCRHCSSDDLRSCCQGKRGKKGNTGPTGATGHRGRRGCPGHRGRRAKKVTQVLPALLVELVLQEQLAELVLQEQLAELV